MEIKKQLSTEEINGLIDILKKRFETNMIRHKNMNWENIHSKITKNHEKCWSLNEMEITGGEPDVVDYNDKTDEYIFYDCSVETPKGRRSICYDREALESRKQFKPSNNALDMASEMGIQLLNENEYRKLQTVGNFDIKTSSWIKTPENIRKLGGAIFCDRRYDTVFLYHNGADSYYGVRGFRGLLKI